MKTLTLQTLWNRLRGTRLLVPGLILLAFLLGLALRGGQVSRQSPGHDEQDHVAGTGSADQETIWTCSMHPQIRLPEPGKCPICFMDLIPLAQDLGHETGERVLTMSETAKKLAEIQTAPVERRFVDARVRLVGRVALDETRVRYITAWVAGRLDRLYVDYTGITVRKGDHLVELYSPGLISAQEELLQSIRAAAALERSQVKSVREATMATVDAARDKLRLLGLTPGQIEALEKRGTPTDRITIYAPIGGIVVHKSATQGMYVDVGTTIYTIADLSVVWIKLDAYESDLVWLRYGQKVEFSTEAYPGDVYRGRIAFIDPVLDPNTRTVKVRVNVENPGGALKPDMFVRATVHARVARGGRAMDPELAGKWVSPMHPEIVKDGPGKCDICGMPLVRAEELGFVSADDPAQAPLVIPASAPLITGRRAIVYIERPDAERPTYEGREVVLGPRAGDFYLVESGLAEGERVVVNGNFKIDSALQIQGRPSMMSAEEGGEEPGARRVEIPAALRGALSRIFDAYFGVQRRLAADDLAGAHEAFGRTRIAVDEAPHEDLTGDLHEIWHPIAEALGDAASAGAEAGDLAQSRLAFRDFSDSMLRIEAAFGHPGDAVHYQIFCPMAFASQGASWLQTSREVSNPYFGPAMARCGEVRGTFAPAEPIGGIGP